MEKIREGILTLFTYYISMKRMKRLNQRIEILFFLLLPVLFSLVIHISVNAQDVQPDPSKEGVTPQEGEVGLNGAAEAKSFNSATATQIEAVNERFWYITSPTYEPPEGMEFDTFENLILWSPGLVPLGREKTTKRVIETHVDIITDPVELPGVRRSDSADEVKIAQILDNKRVELFPLMGEGNLARKGKGKKGKKQLHWGSKVGCAIESVKIKPVTENGKTLSVLEENKKIQVGSAPTTPGQGKRIFPGKTTSDIQKGISPPRNKVKIVAKVTGNEKGVNIFFKSFDVDDPSHHLAPVDLKRNGVQISDLKQQSDFQDNRTEQFVKEGVLVSEFGRSVITESPGGTVPGQPSILRTVRKRDKVVINGKTKEVKGIVKSKTDSQGKAEVILKNLSFQPGDNYRVCAACSKEELGDLEVRHPYPKNPSQTQQASVIDNRTTNETPIPDDDDDPAPKPVKSSPLLTVWRKLHVEVDSMEQEPNTIDDFPERKPDLHLVLSDGVREENNKFKINTGGPLPEVEDFYEGGIVTRPGDPEFLVKSNTDGFFDDDIVIENKNGLTIKQLNSIFKNKVIIVRDDDSIKPLLPLKTIFRNNNEKTFIKRSFASAYIDIQEMSDDLNEDQIVNFDLHLDSGSEFFTEGQLDSGFSSAREVDGSSDFWVDHVVMTYQAEAEVDVDPDFWKNNAPGINLACIEAFDISRDLGCRTNEPPEPKLLGLTREVSESNQSAIFIETIRDQFISSPNLNKISQGTLRNRRVALWQVIAHEIGHAPGSFFNDDHEEGGLMQGHSEEGSLSQTNRQFSGETIERFRNEKNW